MSSDESRKTPRLKAAVPQFYVRDMAAALAFYRDVLGFEIAWTFGEPVELASVCRDEVEFNLVLIAADRFQLTRAYVYVDDVDAYVTQVQAAGAPVVVPLEDRFYGLRDCRIADRDGNEISFGSVLPADTPSVR